MKMSTTHQIKRSLHKLHGDVKAKVGQATNNPNREAEGENETLAGRIRAIIGDIKKAFER